MMISKADLLALTDLTFGAHLAWGNAFREGGSKRLLAILDVLDGDVINRISDEQLLCFLMDKIKQGRKQKHPKAKKLATDCQKRLKLVLSEKGWSLGRVRWLSRFFQVARWIAFLCWVVFFIVSFLSSDVGSVDLLHPILPIVSASQLVFFWTFVTLGQMRRRLLKPTLPFYGLEPRTVALVKAGFWLGVMSSLSPILLFFSDILLEMQVLQLALLLWIKYQIYTRPEVYVWDIGFSAFFSGLFAALVCLLTLPNLIATLGWTGVLIPLPGILVGVLIIYFRGFGYGILLSSPKKVHRRAYVCWWLMAQTGLLLATSWSLTGLKSPAYLVGYDWLYCLILVAVCGTTGLVVWLTTRAKVAILAGMAELDDFIMVVNHLYLFVKEDKERPEVADKFCRLAIFVSQASAGWFSVLAHKPLLSNLGVVEELLDELSCQYILDDLTWLKSLYPGGWERADRFIAAGNMTQYQNHLNKIFQSQELQSQLLSASSRLVQQRMMLLWKLYDYYKQHEDEIRPHLSGGGA